MRPARPAQPPAGQPGTASEQGAGRGPDPGHPAGGGEASRCQVLAVGLRATTLTPFAYHSVPVQSGSATIPEYISDRAIAFALAQALGLMPATPLLASVDSAALPANYRRDLSAIPWRTSILETDEPRLLPPLARRITLDFEGGRQSLVHRVTATGNLKEFFTIQEVPQGVVYRGAALLVDPFGWARRAYGAGELTRRGGLVVRIGLGRAGMLLVEPDPSVEHVRLNAATGRLFGADLPVEKYALHSLQVTPAMPLVRAAQEVSAWI